MKEKKKGMSRRQFLIYTLMGTGGFLVSGVTLPMVRFAIDPVLQPKSDAADFVEVGSADEFSATPKKVDFVLERMDGWYKDKAKLTAYISKSDDGKILALSPICKHLGCVVTWEGAGHANQYYCPCHAGLYDATGVNIPGTPPPLPLDEYTSKIENGKVYLGALRQRGGA